jgi:hypothetical protein
MSPRQEAETRRAADWIGRIPVGESNPLAGKAVDVWRLIKCFGIVGPNIHVTQVVHKKEDDIGVGVAD